MRNLNTPTKLKTYTIGIEDYHLDAIEKEKQRMRLNSRAAVLRYILFEYFETRQLKF